MIAAAWLHDTMEDCGVTREELQEKFGDKVAELVCELTNPSKQHPELSREERKLMDRRQLAAASNEAKLIKLADRADNMVSVAGDKLVPSKFKQKYTNESLLLLEALKGTNESLEREIARYCGA